jgi:hypothetical protein
MRIGLGQLRLSPSCFYAMTLEEFTLAAEGFRELELDRQKQHWERTRWLATLNLQPHMKKVTRLKPTDIAKFPWEKTAKGKANNKVLAATLKSMVNA